MCGLGCLAVVSFGLHIGGSSLAVQACPLGGKSLAERFFTAGCALLGLCPGAAVVGHRVPSSTCTKHSGVARGELNISCLIGHERARGVVQGT